MTSIIGTLFKPKWAHGAVGCVVIQPLIWKVLGSNVGREADYPE
jgi:hypothetical protein